MKIATAAKLPKKSSAKVNDPDNPAWTEDMLDAPVLKEGLGTQAARDAEILKRIADYERGGAALSPTADVFAEARRLMNDECGLSWRVAS